MKIFKMKITCIALVVCFVMGVQQLAMASQVEEEAVLNKISLTSPLNDARSIIEESSGPLEIYESNSNQGGAQVNSKIFEALDGHEGRIVKFHIRCPTFEMLQQCKGILKKATNLQVFSTFSYGHNEMDERSYQLVANLIPGWSSLKALNFTSSNFGDQAAGIIFPALYGSKTLEVLAMGFDNTKRGKILSSNSIPLFEELLGSCPRFVFMNMAGTCFIRGTKLSEDAPEQASSYNDYVTKEGAREAKSYFSEEYSGRVIGYPELYDGLFYVKPLGYEGCLGNLEGLEKLLPPNSQRQQEVRAKIVELKGIFDDEVNSLPKDAQDAAKYAEKLTEIWVNP